MEQQSFFRSVLHRAHLAHKSFVILECAPDGVQIPGWELTRAAGLSADESHAKHRTHSIEFKRQIAQDFIAGETLHALANRHDISRNLIRIWGGSLRLGRSMMTPRRLICFRTTRQRSRRWSAWSVGRPSKSSF